MPNLNEAWKYDTDNLVWNVSASSTGDVFVAGSWDTNIHMIDRKGNPLWKYKTGDFVASVAVSADAETVVGGSYDKHLYALGRSGKLIFKFKADSYVRGAGVSPSGSRIAAATWSGAVYGFDRRGQQQWKADLGANPLSLAVAGDGGQTVVGCADSTIRLLDGSGKEVWKFETGSAVLTVAASARGGFFAAGSTDTHIYLLDGSGKLLWKYRTGGVVRGVALSESGEYVLATSHDRYLYFFERSGKLLWISKVTPEVWTVGSSGMCDTILLGCRDNSVRLLENIEIVKVQMEAARSAIQRAEEEGADAGDAKRTLTQAESSSGAGNIQDSLSLAGKAKANAESALDARLTELINAKLAEFDRMASELREKHKSASRVEWATQRAKKLMDARRLKKALESARRSEAYLKGLPAEEPKPIIPEEVVAAPAPEEAADDELRPAAEMEYNRTMAEVAELEKSGADVSEAAALLEKASGAIGRKDYFVAAEFISSAGKLAESIKKRRGDAAAKISEAEAAMAGAKGAGADVGPLENTMKMAHDAMEAGEFDLSVDYAGQALGLAKEQREKVATPAAAKAPAAAPKAEGAPKCPNCGKKVKAQWKSCPFCRTRLK